MRASAVEKEKLVEMENIKKNYRSLEAIEGEMKNVDLENLLDFD